MTPPPKLHFAQQGPSMKISSAMKLYVTVLLALSLSTASAADYQQSSPSCNGCAAGLNKLLKAFEEPERLVDRHALEKLIDEPLIETTNVSPNNITHTYYHAILSGPPHMSISWSLGNKNQIIITVSINKTPQQRDEQGDLDNCLLPNDLKILSRLGWRYRGKEDVPTHYSEEYEKAGHLLYLGYSARHQCLGFMSLSTALQK